MDIYAGIYFYSTKSHFRRKLTVCYRMPLFTGNRADAKIHLELQKQSRLDLEASERRISRLVKRVDELEDLVRVKEVNEDAQNITLLETQQENKELKRLGERLKLTKSERNLYLTQINDLNLKLELVSGDYKKGIEQLHYFQEELMTALGVTDADLVKSVANGGIGESKRSCGPVKLHNYLRSAVETIRSEYNGKAQEAADLKTREQIKSSELKKEVETLKTEINRNLEVFRDHESQIQYLSNEIKLLRTFLTDELVKEAEDKIQILVKDKKALNQTLLIVKKDFHGKMGRLSKLLRQEQEKCDILRNEGLQAKKDVDAQWRHLWEQHSARMEEELETLQSNVKEPLKSSQAREIALQQQLFDLEERYNESKKSWEEYRKNLFDQLEEWKKQYIQKCVVLEGLEEEKAQVTLKLEEKQSEIENCQSMLNEGVIERHSLQDKVEALQLRLRELVEVSETSSLDSLINLSPKPSWFSLGDFRKMKNKMKTRNSNNQELDL